MSPRDKLLLCALRREHCARTPFWLMRQAGRYLPEYRAVRAEAGSFLKLCLTPDLATEVTLQPIRRYGMDAAILFADILLVPHALGQDVTFADDHGPRLVPINGPEALHRLSLATLHKRLAPVYETIRQVRQELPAETTLIGFAGAPWTVATYMVEGGTSRDFNAVKNWAYAAPASFRVLIDLLVEATTAYLVAQIEAGAEVLQLFDSWAGVLPEEPMRQWALAPMRAVVERVKRRHPEVPVIAFPRGAGLIYADFADAGVDALGLDSGVPLDWAAATLQPRCALQGNLDPMLLVVGGSAMRQATLRILERLGRGPFIFNLGHGILPHTPPDHVTELAELLRERHN